MPRPLRVREPKRLQEVTLLRCEALSCWIRPKIQDATRHPQRWRNVLLKLLFHALVLMLESGHGLFARTRMLALAIFHEHWRALKSALYVLLGLVVIGSGASFALVNLGPDAALLQPRWMMAPLEIKPLTAIEPLATLGSSEQADSIEDPLWMQSAAPSALSPRAFFVTRWSRNLDSVQSTLAQLGIEDAKALSYLLSTTSTRQALLSNTQKLLSAERDEAHQLKALTLRWADTDPQWFNRLVVKRTASGFESLLSKAKYDVQVQVAGAKIKSSLFQATDQAHIPDAVANQLVEIFSGDIDFHRALRTGDRFSLMYENLLADGEVFKTGKILNAEFINRGKSYQAVWFSESNSTKGDYYSMDGLNLKRTFLASPLTFSRVSSGFSMRFHPILQTWKAHLGVDYAAVTGTPVRAVGTGVVESAGPQGGFGNVVFIKHPQGPVTVYAHLSRIGVKKGQSVSQGETIGAVGMTGWATGPHLHFEFRLNGQHQDPMTLAKQNTPIPLANEFKPQFMKQARLAQSALANLSESSLETVDID